MSKKDQKLQDIGSSAADPRAATPSEGLSPHPVSTDTGPCNTLQEFALPKDGFGVVRNIVLFEGPAHGVRQAIAELQRECPSATVESPGETARHRELFQKETDGLPTPAPADAITLAVRFETAPPPTPTSIPVALVAVKAITDRWRKALTHRACLLRHAFSSVGCGYGLLRRAKYGRCEPRADRQPGRAQTGIFPVEASFLRERRHFLQRRGRRGGQSANRIPISSGVVPRDLSTSNSISLRGPCSPRMGFGTRFRLSAARRRLSGQGRVLASPGGFNHGTQQLAHRAHPPRSRYECRHIRILR